MKLEQFDAEVVPHRTTTCAACPLAQPCEPIGETTSHGVCFCGHHHAPLRRFIAAPHMACPRNRWAKVEVEGQPPPTEEAPAPLHGPGKELHDMLTAAFGLDVIKGCSCQKVIDKMNRLGVEGCREPGNFKKIVGHLMTKKDMLSDHARQLVEQEQKQPTWGQWVMRTLATVVTKLTPEQTQRMGIEWLVHRAIDKAELEARQRKDQG